MFRRYTTTDTQEIADNLAKLSAYMTSAQQRPGKFVPIQSEIVPKMFRRNLPIAESPCRF